MGILNRASDGQLSILLAFHRALLHHGPLAKQDLLDLCAPRSLWSETKKDDDSTNEKAQLQARNTLNRWREIGFFSEASDEEKTISLSVEGAAPRTAIRRLLLSPANNLNILSKRADAEIAGLCADFTRGACWVLAQDSYEFSGAKWDEVDALMKKQVSIDPRPVQNDTRWNALRDDYAPFLGLGWLNALSANAYSLITDPTEAVRDELPGVFDTTKELPIGRFLEALAIRLPIVDGGLYRLEVEQYLQEKDMWKPCAPHEVSTSLSRALIRLEESGELQLPSRSDSPEQKILLGRSGHMLQKVSHVMWRNASR